MRHGPLIFLGLLFALALSWLGMVAAPQLQIGNAQPTNVPPSDVLYPVPRSGLAAVGHDVYRANGCAYCHTQIVRQDGTRFDLVVSKAGTNEAGVVEALGQISNRLSPARAQSILTALPATVLTVESKSEADAAQKLLSTAGAEASVRVVPTGPEIQRGWGNRLTVAQDYVYERPLLLGSARVGPDLANVGLRRPDETWHLIHLYNARLEVPGSIMPRYPFLFEKHRRGGAVSAQALPIAGEFEVIPTPEARALAAYLVSLRSEMPLFAAPAPTLATAPGAGDTNQPAASGVDTNTAATAVLTNAPPTNQAPPK